MIMLKALLKRFWRPLLAIWATCALGIAVMVGLSGGCLSLEKSTLAYLDEYQYFDACITTQITADDKLADLAAVPGVKHVDARMVANTVMVGPNKKHYSIRAMTFLPSDWQKFVTWESAKVGKRDAICVEYEFAKNNNIHAGDELRVRIDGPYRTYVVESLVSAPETLSLRAFDNVSSLNSDFGYVYVPISLVEKEPNPDYDRIQRELDKRTGDVDKSESAARQTYDQAIGEIEQAQDELQQRLQEAHEALGQSDALRSDLDQKDATAKDALAQIEQAQNELSNTYEQLSAQRQQLVASIDKATEAQEALAAQQAELEETRDQLVSKKEQLEGLIAQLEQAKEALARIDESMALAQQAKDFLSDDDVALVVSLLEEMDPNSEISAIAQQAQALSEFYDLCASYGIAPNKPGTAQQASEYLLVAMDTLSNDLELLSSQDSVDLARRIDNGDEEARASEQGQSLARVVSRYTLQGLSESSLQEATSRCQYLQDLVDNYDLYESTQTLSKLPQHTYDQWLSTITELGDYAELLPEYLGPEFANITTVGQLLEAYHQAPDALNKLMGDLKAQRAEIVAQLAQAGVAEKDVDTAMATLRDTIAQVASGLSQTDEGLGTLDDALAQAYAALTSLNAGIDKMDEGLAQADAGIQQLSQQRQEAYTALERIDAARAELDATISQAQEGIGGLNELNRQLLAKRQDADSQWEQGLTEFSHLRDELDKARAELGEWRGYQAFHNQFLLWFEEGANPNKTLKMALAALAPTEIKSSYTFEDSPVKSRLDNNVVPLRSLSYFMPGVFFGVVLVVAFLFMSLIVRQSRTNIGILRALGKSAGELRAIFCSLGLLVTVGSVPLGLGIGYGLVRYMADYFTDFFNLPSFTCQFDSTMLILAVVLTIAVVQLATLIGTSLLSSILPSEALSRALPNMSRVPRLVELLTQRLDELSKFSVVSLLRNPVRLGFSVVCIAASMSIILSAQSFLASKNHHIYQEFGLRLKYDAQIFLSSEPTERLLAQLDELDYVSDTQRMGFYSCTIAHGNESEEATINAVQQGTDLVGIHDAHGQRIEVPRAGIVLDEHLAQQLDVAQGDSVTVNGQPMRVNAISKQDTARVQYVSLSQAKALGEGNLGCIVCRIDPKDEQRLLKFLAKRDDYVFTVFTDVLYDSSERLYATYDLSAWILTGFSVAIGALVMINVMQTNLLERKRELCVLRTLGFGHGRISLALFCQTLLYVGLSCLVGLPVGKLIAQLALERISSPDRTFAYANGPREYLATVLIVLGYATVSHLLAMRSVQRWNINEGVRDKE